MNNTDVNLLISIILAEVDISNEDDDNILDGGWR